MTTPPLTGAVANAVAATERDEPGMRRPHRRVDLAGHHGGSAPEGLCVARGGGGRRKLGEAAEAAGELLGSEHGPAPSA